MSWIICQTLQCAQYSGYGLGDLVEGEIEQPFHLRALDGRIARQEILDRSAGFEVLDQVGDWNSRSSEYEVAAVNGRVA